MEDKIKQRAKELYDKTHVPGIFQGNAVSYQKASLEEIEAHLRLLDRVGREYNKTLYPEKYPVGISESELRESAKIYWTKGKRIQSSKNLKAKQDDQRALIQEAMKLQPNSQFLNSLLEQTYQKNRQLSKKQIEITEGIIKAKKPVVSSQPLPQTGTTNTEAPSPPESKSTTVPRTKTQTQKGFQQDLRKQHSVVITENSPLYPRWQRDRTIADVEGIDTRRVSISRRPGRISPKMPRLR